MLEQLDRYGDTAIVYDPAQEYVKDGEIKPDEAASEELLYALAAEQDEDKEDAP